MMGRQPPRRPAPPLPRVVAVCLELEGGQLVRLPLVRPVTLRDGRDRGPVRVEIIGDRAFLTVDG